MLQIGALIVELDLHPHRSQRLYEMSLVRRHESGMAGLKDYLGLRLDHRVAHSTIEHPNDTPHAPLGAVLLADASGKVFSSKTAVRL